MIEFAVHPRRANVLQPALETALIDCGTRTLQCSERSSGQCRVPFDQGLCVVLIEGGQRRKIAASAVRDDFSRRSLATQRTAVDRIDSLTDACEVITQMIHLFLAEARETVVIGAAEGGLAVADEEQGTHVETLIEAGLYAA